MHRTVTHVKRVVVKIGTNLLSDSTGINMRFLEKIAYEISGLKKRGYQPLIVSSGAIGLGAKEMGCTQSVKTVVKRQAYASIGMPILMHTYRLLFSSYGMTVAQILLTRSILTNRKSFLNLKNSVEDLLEMGVIPVINENDSVSTAEIGTAFGDNDSLSALVASKIDADLLIILSDIDGLYTADPRKDSSARFVDTVESIDSEVLSWAKGAGSTFSTGGMKTKLKAAQIAATAGCGSIIARGTEPNILQRIMDGEMVGTYFRPSHKRSQRERWILQAATAGRIEVDDGAIEALRNHKSLLPSGIVSVKGSFEKGEVVAINDVAKAVPSFSSQEIIGLIGEHSSRIRDKIGNDRRDVIARPEDIAFLS